MPFHDLEIAGESAAVNQAADTASKDTITYLTRDGQRIAAIVSADLIPVLLGTGEPSDPDALHRRVDLLARIQGIEPITDPAQLRGPGMPPDEWAAFSAAMQGERPKPPRDS